MHRFHVRLQPAGIAAQTPHVVIVRCTLIDYHSPRAFVIIPEINLVCGNPCARARVYYVFELYRCRHDIDMYYCRFLIDYYHLRHTYVYAHVIRSVVPLDVCI